VSSVDRFRAWHELLRPAVIGEDQAECGLIPANQPLLPSMNPGYDLARLVPRADL
jgi:hypothetical protein